MVTPSIDWEQQANQERLEGNYTKAAALYERAIETQPEQMSLYWHLGMVYLLQGQEEEAHTTWLMGMAEGSEEQIAEWTFELVQLLETEAIRLEVEKNESAVWLIRQHIREIAPTDIHNLLNLMQLGIADDTLSAEDLQNWEIIELLQTQPTGSINSDLLLQVLQKLLNFAPLHPSSIAFAHACLPHLDRICGFRDVLLETAMTLTYSYKQPEPAISLAKLALEGNPQYPAEILGNLASFYDYAHHYSLAIETAKQCYERMDTLPDKVFGTYLLIKTYMSRGGYWNEAVTALEQQEQFLLELIQQPPLILDPVRARRLLTSTFFYPYLRDAPEKNRKIQNAIAELCQSYLQKDSQERVNKYSQYFQQRRIGGKAKEKRLKIGYISHCFRTHSVGWLARWLFQYHDRNKFDIYGYFINYQPLGNSLQDWYVSQMTRAYQVGSNSIEIAEQIARDEIDILIELDSLTLDSTFTVMALKPAPIQVTWLGWDAVGLPAIDYYIADPYVLPEQAQNYYQEKIWRLPQTYIAVDGFEVGVPTLRRDRLEIPTDAVVYFSGQTAYKRHPHTVRLQMKILKAVPNSYFLIKTRADEEAVKTFFTQLADEEGVESDRLRFLPTDSSEEIHRANLSIADVVLDTYPYNGATTTLETLWMGVPLVTRVGEQFSARNSYTMMINAGVTEGIAWTDQEYVEWGIRLGSDRQLREEISSRLLRSRQSAPLWNAKQFTREMENAYQQMWQRYLDATP
ncbi:tetratricopeptide repeat protein [Laspinema olomoucense]|uniref:O-linked N-acetylglucosamine transferase, SPINDLY family protein n=1 Tax=Laspinema olomoucense TaxID=3231600 RepID=UPI0021BABD58|nr:tetratricopeptide repeat protein [Laspinema sp. D3a]MCT7989224.1 tetratricopeptide repeat protein [Laspinema sp. D3a]